MYTTAGVVCANGPIGLFGHMIDTGSNFQQEFAESPEIHGVWKTSEEVIRS